MPIWLARIRPDPPKHIRLGMIRMWVYWQARGVTVSIEAFAEKASVSLDAATGLPEQQV